VSATSSSECNGEYQEGIAEVIFYHLVLLSIRALTQYQPKAHADAIVIT